MEVNMALKWANDPTDNSIIKVIGVGGGGVNAVDYMYKCGIKGVKFAACNTDAQSFDDINVPVKITLGKGLGAGGDPEEAKKEFEVSIAEVEKLFNDDTQMVFIAAGMGGGTGSGAAPLIAKMAKEKNKLTVGVVTIPFAFEGVPRIITALDAVEEMSRNVDALIVINNEDLQKSYSHLNLDEAFEKPDEVLLMAVKSIAEIITVKGKINRDFKDVKKTMENGGVALVSHGFGKGENRLKQSIENAINSPLLNNKDIHSAERILFYISYRKDSNVKIEEIKYMNDFMKIFGNNIKLIWGHGVDDSLEVGQEMKFTLIATGFGLDAVPEMKERNKQKLQKDTDMRDKNIERIQAVYGEDIYSIHLNRVSQSSIIILTMDEMENDSLISFMEKHPTYNRSPKEIAKIRKSPKSARRSSDSTATETSENKKVIIEF